MLESNILLVLAMVGGVTVSLIFVRGVIALEKDIARMYKDV